MDKVVSFYVEESKRNNGMKILVAVCESGEKYVVAGDHWTPTAMVKYENCFETNLNDKP
jgi:hypothetical protein